MTVGIVIVSHSAMLAKGVVELASQMAEGVPMLAAGGGPDNTLGTSVDTILTAIEAVNGPAGTLVLLDQGSALLSTEMAIEMLEEQHGPVEISYAPLVEGAVVAAMEASLGRSLQQVRQAAEKVAEKAQLLQFKPVYEEEPVEEREIETLTDVQVGQEQGRSLQVVEAEVTISDPAGLHARPASQLVQTAGRFVATIEVAAHGKQTEATSIIGLLSLGVRQGETLTLRGTGPQAEQAITALTELLQSDTYQAEPTSINTSTPLQYSTSNRTTSSHGWQGISVSPGVAVGPALVYTSQIDIKNLEVRTIPAAQVAAEQQRLHTALQETMQELREQAQHLQTQIGQNQAAIFEAQALMLDDPGLLSTALTLITEKQQDAASALATAVEQAATMLEGLHDAVLSGRAVDMRDAASRAIRRLRGETASSLDLNALSEPVILLAHELTPSDTAQLRPTNTLGICTVAGGPTAHAAILARALGISAIAGIDEIALQQIKNGNLLGLDADNAVLYLQPDEEIRTQLTQRLMEQKEQQARLQTVAQQEVAPLNVQGRQVHLYANVGSEAEAEAARQWGAEGIGLLRTEFLFASTSIFPDEERQRQLYIKLFQTFTRNTSEPSRPVVVRTLDAGADKPLPALTSLIDLPAEANPALGLRGIRIQLAHQELLRQQLRALLRAAGETNVQLHVMFPMITTLEELQQARQIFDQVYADLHNAGMKLSEHVPVGIMIEVPAAALMAKELAGIADFFSIGANDLLQYVTASDRTNANVAHIYQPLQPAFLRLIHQIVEAAKQAGKPVAVCGEIASDVRLAPLLVAMGVDELSMVPSALPAIRAALTTMEHDVMNDVVQKVLQAKTLAEVEQIVC